MTPTAPSPVRIRPAPRIVDVLRGPRLRLEPGQRARNLVDLVWRTVELLPHDEAIRWKAEGAWRSRTYAELGDWTFRLSLGLASLGLARGDRIAIICTSRPEWLAADLAALALGAVTCPIHPAERPELVERMLVAVSPRIAIVDGSIQAKRVTEIASRCRSLETVVTVEPVAGFRSLGELASKGSPTDAERREWREGWERIDRADTATIVHTSGSTGTPKGVVLTHGNIVHNCEAAAEAIPFTRDDVALTILPLSHMFARAAGMFVPLSLGVTVAFAEPVMARWAANLLEVRPTVMLTVPPFFQRIYKRITDEVAAGPAWKQRAFSWAVGLGRRRYENHLGRREDGAWLTAQLAIARLLVLRHISSRTGGRLRFFACGAAPLPREIGEIFYAMDILILEGYGLSETAPFLSLNDPESFKFGTVGHPFAETEIGLDADTGEILARGPQVMHGYLDDAEATAEAIDAEGWFHTGDIGTFDEDRRLVITDRIKNLIVLANGKKVTPGPMQTALAASPYVAQSVFLGDGHESTGVLLAPDFEHLRTWATGVGLTGLDDGGLAARPEVRALLEGEARRLLAGFAAWERPRRIAILPRRLSEELGELTAMGKPKRAVIEANWPDAVTQLFEHRLEPKPKAARP